MYRPDGDEGCPMCSMWVDGLHGVLQQQRLRHPNSRLTASWAWLRAAWCLRAGGVWSCARVRTLAAVVAVPDTLSQGGDGERGPWPRRVAVAAMLVLAVVAVIVAHLPRARHSPARTAASATSPVVASGATGLSAVRDGITGPVSPWPGGLRLPVAGQRPTWFWPGTGQVMAVRGLPPQRSGYEFTRAVGGWAIQAGPATQASCGGCAGPQRAVYFLASRAQSVTPVGVADSVAPGAVGTLWLTSYSPDADPGTAAGTAREVSTAGRPLGPPLRLPAGYQIERATGHGLLLAPVAPRPGTMADQLWDPATRAAARSFNAVIAASTTQIAWAPPCTTRCRVLLMNLASGRQITAEPPAGRSVASAAFSPDGKWLAIETSFSNEADDGGQAVQLELVSTASGRLMAVPGTWLSSDALISFGWPASSDTLVAELSFTTKVQLTSWRPGASQPAVAMLAPRQTPATLVTGQYTP
jgi:hypothetical protein